MLKEQPYDYGSITSSELILKSRVKSIYKEFKYAWDNCPKTEKIKWCKDSVVLFGKVTVRRGKGFFGAAKI